MAWSLSTFSVVAIGSAAVALAVGLAALRERPDDLALPLSLLMFAIAAWAVPDAISFGYADVGAVVFWQRVTYFGVVTAPVAYLVFSLRYAGYEGLLSRRVYAALAVVPVVTLLAVWTNPLHGLFWASVSIARVDGASVLRAAFGPLYWVNLGYLYLVTLGALAVLGTVAVRSGTVYRKQAALMFVGGIVPLATNVAVQSGLGPDVDLTTTALTVTGVTYALALFHFDLLEIRPVARARLLDELDDGVVVVGPNGRVRDFNRTAAEIIEGLAVERPAEEVLPESVVPDGGDLVVETEDGVRRFRARSTPLTGRAGRDVGRIVYFSDVTALVERDQRISVLNRILRHNVRNRLNVVSGNLDLLEDHVSEAGREYVETAREGTRRLLETSDKARFVEQTLRRSNDPDVVGAGAVVRRVVSDARDRYPDATFETDLPDAGDEARIIDERLVETAVAELVENAVIHGAEDGPRVTVRVESADGHVAVAVADNGPGISERERAALSAPIETQLEHGSGLGLWLVRWTASLSSGELEFAGNEPRGTVVTLRLPAAEA